MFTKTLNKKDLIKRVNYQLTANFYSLNEFRELTNKDAFKVIKLISKIEGIKLKRNEIREIVISIKSLFVKTTKTISKLWSFVKNYNKKQVSNIKKIIIKIFNFIISSYRENKFELMII